MNFCSSCGVDRMVFRVPRGDNRPRWICGACDQIFYENPRIIVGTLPVWEGQVLLCRRAIRPKPGFWTLPAGFMENGETVEAGAARETMEESGAAVRIGALHTLFNVPQVNQVYMLFLAEIVEPAFPFGPETSEVRLVDPGQIPWEEIAFESVRRALHHWAENPNAPDAVLPHRLVHSAIGDLPPG